MHTWIFFLLSKVFFDNLNSSFISSGSNENLCQSSQMAYLSVFENCEVIRSVIFFQ